MDVYALLGKQNGAGEIPKVIALQETRSLAALSSDHGAKINVPHRLTTEQLR